MKLYRVEFTMKVYDEIEANSQKEAEDIFFEMWNSADEMIRDFGNVNVQRVVEDEHGFRDYVDYDDE